jgi:hypothetical protein
MFNFQSVNTVTVLARTNCSGGGNNKNKKQGCNGDSSHGLSLCLLILYYGSYDPPSTQCQQIYLETK